MLLRKGSKGNAVRQLQEKLGVDAGGAWGTFGPKTEEAVKKWQKNHGLNPDGIVGPLTWGALFEVGNFNDLDPVDFHEDGQEIDDPDDDPNASFPTVGNMDLNRLKGRIPDTVIVQISKTSATFAINTSLRLAHFLAQVAHESGGFKFTEENLNYSETGLKKTFGRYFRDNLASDYARQPVRIASRVYAGRMGNSDEASKDGWKYRGRGYIQLTGKANYQQFDTFVSDDIMANPDLVATKYPLLSAAWFWDDRALNDRADQGSSDATVRAITRRINGGENGFNDRLSRFREYYTLLG